MTAPIQRPLLRTRRSKRFVAAALGVGFFAAMQSVTATADVIVGQAELQRQMQKAANGNDELNVLIGGTVALTTDQKGNWGSFNLFLNNGQITGNGSGEVTMPTGPDTTKTIEVESTPGEVQTWTNLGGAFTGEMPLTLRTEVTVNGEKIDPDQAYGLTGDVEIKYIFNNLTSRKQEVSWENIHGKTVTKEMDVAVPFGGTFGLTFGDDWFVKSVDGVATHQTPDGTELFGQVIFFPIIPGKVGSTEAIVTVKAVAEDASIPGTTLSSVPVDLSSYVSGLALDLVPQVEEELLIPASGLISSIAGDVASIAYPLGGFAGSLDDLNSNGLQPLLDSIADLEVDPEALADRLRRNGQGLADLGELLEANQVAQDQVSALLIAMSELLGTNVANLVGNLGLGLQKLGPNADLAADALLDLTRVFESIDPALLTENVEIEDATCVPVGKTSRERGQDPLAVAGVELSEGSATWQAINKVIEDNTPNNPLNPTPQWVKDLKALNNQLSSQVTETMFPKLLSGVLAEGDSPSSEFLLTTPTCRYTNLITTQGIIPLGQVWDDTLGPEAPKLIAGLKLISRVGESGLPDALGKVKDLLRRVGKLLSNDNCSVEALLGPIQDADNLDENVGAVLQEILSNCGLAQIVAYLGAIDATIGGALGEVGELLETAADDSDSIAAGVDSVANTAETAAAGLDELPPALNEVVDGILAASGKINTGGQEAIGDVSSSAAELDAMLNAMTDRTLAGDGTPYGASTGTVPVKSWAAYQITQTPPASYSRNWGIAVAVALVFLVVGAGVGTVLYRRRRAGTAGKGAAS